MIIVAILGLPTTNCRDEYINGWFYKTYLELVDVPDDIPGDAVGVYLNSNNIKELKVGAFSNLPNCTFLSLSRNLIQNIQSVAFEGLKSVQDLILFVNELSELRPGMFRGLDSLQYTVLSNNSTKHI